MAKKASKKPAKKAYASKKKHVYDFTFGVVSINKIGKKRINAEDYDKAKKKLANYISTKYPGEKFNFHLVESPHDSREKNKK